MLEIIPAIDLKNGNCVRLIQGQKDQETIYDNDPVAVAKMWEEKGAKRLHIVDLDGAFSGEMQNFEIIKQIRREVNMLVEVGGGIRNIETVDMLVENGVDKIILGTIAVEKPELVEALVKKYPNKIIVGIDEKKGRIAVSGWETVSEITLEDIISHMLKLGVNEFIYTDISKDGMLAGPSLEKVKNILKNRNVKIIVSGGISSIEDIRRVLEIKDKNILGIITGKALYDNRLKLDEAILLTREYDN